MKAKLFILSLFMIPSMLLQAYSSMDERISQLEKEMNEVGEINIMGNFGTSFTTARTEGKKGVFIFVDPLYWHAKVGGTEFTTTEEFAANINDRSHPPNNGVLKYNDFGWDWGIRVGLGYNLARDMWDVNLNYTWFETNGSESVQKNYPSALRPTRTSESAFVRWAKSSFDVSYNNVNLELGRHYYISKMVSTHPFIGLKSTWLDLKQRVTYQPITPGEGEEGGLNKFNDKSHLWGLGPRAGLSVEGYIGDGFSFAGMVAGALLYSHDSALIHMKSDDNTSSLGSDLSIKLRGKEHLFVPTVQMFLGLIWETSFFNKTKCLTLGAGYEVEYYWRANQMMVVEDMDTPNSSGTRRGYIESVSEDVMFYGLTLKARLDF